MKLHRYSLIGLCLLLISSGGAAYAEGGPVFGGVERPRSSLVFEFQAYPTGIIPGFTYERFFSPRQSLNFRIGRQIIRHGDEGRQDDERGEGGGGNSAAADSGSDS